MRYSTSCKEGLLQLTDDDFLQVVGLFGGAVAWREPASAVRAFSVKPGMMLSCSIVVHATNDYQVTMLTRKDLDRLCQLLSVQVTMVTQLPAIAPPQQPAPAPQSYAPQPVQPSYPPQPLPPQGFAPQAYPPQPVYQPAPAPMPPQMETTVKTYKTAKDYQRDIKKMQRQGWSVQNSLDHHRDRSLAYKAFVPFGVFSGGTGQIVVTYQRPKK